MSQIRDKKAHRKHIATMIVGILSTFKYVLV